MGFADDWKRAGEESTEFDPPDGSYTVRITDGSAFAGKDGREWAKLTLEVQDGEHQGRTFVDFMNLNNDVGLRIARENLTLYGLKADDIDALEDLDSGMLELTGTEADVTVKHSSGGFLNVNVNRVKTGRSDIPAEQQAFDTPDMQPAAAKPRGAYDNDIDIPF